MAYHTVKTLLTALLTTVEAELESAWSRRTLHSQHPHTWIHFQLWEEAGETRSETVACLFTPQLPVLKIKLKLDQSCPAHLSPVIQTHTADVLTLRAGSPQVHSLRWAATPVTDESARLNFPPHFTLSSWSWSRCTSSHWSSAHNINHFINKYWSLSSRRDSVVVFFTAPGNQKLLNRPK